MKFYLGSALFFLGSIMAGAVNAADMHDEIEEIVRRWDHAAFELTDSKAELSALRKLDADAWALSAANPMEAEPVMWCGIIAATEAGEAEGVAALQFAEAAKGKLEKAAAMAKPEMLSDGLLESMLGALYAQAPGFPVGFGNKGKARAHLLKALAQNPSSIDANYFYGDFLFRQGLYADAKKALNIALKAPDRPGREIGDKGRRAEAATMLALVEVKMARH